MSGTTDAAVTGAPVAVDTLAPSVIAAGEEIDVRCVLSDAAGETFPVPAGIATSIRWSPAASVQVVGGTAIALRAGQVEASCQVPSLMLIDDSPASIEIAPGPPVSVTTTLEAATAVAGEPVTASCIALDAQGNPVVAIEPMLVTSPSVAPPAGVTVTIDRAGRYDVSCILPGATGEPASLEVVPALPAAISIRPLPMQDVYAGAQVIEVAVEVTDRYGNPVPDADVDVTSAPEAAQRLGARRFRYDADGVYVVTATLVGPTQSGEPLSADAELVVNARGPSITCGAPANGAMIDAAPGAPLMFSGMVADPSGIREVRVNGVIIHAPGAPGLGADGSFVVPVDTRWGINLLDVVAIDDLGAEHSRTCAFLLSDHWAGESSILGDTLMLQLRQAGVDNGSLPPPIVDLADLLTTAVNSSGPRNAIHGALSASPQLENRCEARAPVTNTCLFRWTVNYRDTRIQGPNRVSLALVSGGIRVDAHFENVGVRLDIDTTVGDAGGWVTVRTLDVGLVLDVTRSGGAPRATLRASTLSVSSGRVDIEFGGITGRIVDAFEGLVNGELRGLVEQQLRNWARDNLDDVLDGVLSDLDVTSLGRTFSVPRLDGTGDLSLSLAIDVSTVDLSSARALFGIGSRITAPAAQPRPSLGIALSSSRTQIDPTSSRPMAVALHSVVLNQALHALWRGGLFDASLEAGDIDGSLPDGLEVEIEAALPPVVAIRADGHAELGIGALSLTLRYPGVFDDLSVELGARVSAPVRLEGERLRVGALNVEDLRFSTEDASITDVSRQVLEDFLRELLGDLARSALEDALPTLPIPGFRIPSSLGSFGLPVGRTLGVISPDLALEPPHLILRSSVGIR